MQAKKWLVRPMVVAISGCFSAAPSWANPTGPQIVNGAVTLQRPDARTLNVTNSPKAIINWQGFSVGAGEVTRFIQQSTSSAVLNRVVGADISRIAGQLLSNGRVFLINPAGIVIGAGAVIDTAGFVGSTLKMQDADFLAGKLKFQGDGSSGSIVNHGYIKAGQGGNIVLVAPTIENGAGGVLETQGGQLILAAGRKLTIGSLDLEGVQFEIQAPSDSVLNVGKLLADGGAVGVFAGTLKHSGDIRANALTRDEAGRIVLRGQGDVTVAAGSTITTNGKTGGNITIQSGDTTLVSGEVSAKGSDGRGGTVQILGHRVGLIDSASVNASGDTGGGTILVGGDLQGKNSDVMNAWRTFAGPDVTLRADALTSGDGGKVIVWADDVTRVYSTISARGGALSGNGGFVETSGKTWMDFAASVDTSAPHGKTGTLLLDPKDIEVTDAAGAGQVTYQAGTTDLFADNANGITRFFASVGGGPGSISAFTGANVSLQASNDITFTSAINNTNPNVMITAQAGRSIFVNANIQTFESDITMTANDINAQPGNRDPGQAMLRMAPGTTINAATSGSAGIVRLIMGQGVAGAGSGDIIIANLRGADVSVLHNGPTANGRILRAADSLGVAPEIRVARNGGNVHLEIEAAAGGPSSSIGTSAAPIQIFGTTAFLEAHYHGGGAGIFIDSLSDVQIGGATTVFNGTVKGVQTISTAGAAGPIRITSPGTLSQEVQGGTPAICGSSPGGASGGPICAGAGTGSTNPLDIVTLRAADMVLQAPIAGNSVILLPQANGTIGMGGGAGTLQLDQLQINQITTTSLRIGERTGDSNAPAPSDTASSGDIAFGSGITAPGTAQIEFRTGGSITTTQGAGTTDITTNNAAITLHAGTGVGSTGAGRLKLNPGTFSVTLSATSGGFFLEHTVGDLNTLAYGGGSGDPNAVFELATTDGNILASNSIFGNTQYSYIAGGVNRNIAFSTPLVGTGTYNAASLTLSPTGITTFNSDSGGRNSTFNTAVTTSRPISFGGGTANFNRAVTGNTATGTLTISSGAANFNAASTVAGAITLSGGTLGGMGAVTGNNGLTFTGGTISNTGGVTIPGTTIINVAGTPQLSGRLSTGVLDMSAGTLDITSTGVLTLAGPGTSVIGNATINNAGRVNYNTAGNDLVLDTGSVFNNQMGGTFDIQRDIFVPAGAGRFDNAGTVLKSGGLGIGGFPDTLRFDNNGGTLTSNSGTLVVGTGTHSGVFTANGTGTVQIRDGTHTFTNGSSIAGKLNFAGGTLSIPAGTATIAANGTLEWEFGPISGPGTLAVANGGVVNLSAGSNSSHSLTTNVTLANAGTVRYNTVANALLLDTGSVFNNQMGGTFDIQRDIFATTGAGRFDNAGTVLKSGGAGIGGFPDTLRFDNNGGTLTSNSGTLVVGTGTHSGVFTANGTGTVQIRDGTHTFTNGSSIAGKLNFAGGTLSIPAGTATIAANGTLEWEFGVISGPGTLAVANGGLLSLILGSNASHPLNNVTLANAGTVLYNTVANALVLNAGSVFDNQAGGTFDIQRDFLVVAGGGSFNNAGIVRKSSGTGVGGFDATLPTTSSGTLDAQIGTLQFAGTNTFNSGTAFTDSGVAGAGVNLVTGNSTFNTAGAAITSTNLTLGGAGASYGGTGTLGGTVIWTDGMVTGGLSNPGSGTWNLNGGLPKIISGNFQFNNAGTMNLNGGSLSLRGLTTFSNTGSFNIAGDFNIQNTGAVTFLNEPAGAFLTKTGGIAVSQIGTDGLLSFRNGIGPANSGTIRVVAPVGIGTPTLEMNGTFAGNTNHGTITLGSNTAFAARSSFTTNNGLINVGNGAVFLTTANTFTNTRNIILTNGTFSMNDGTAATNNNSLVNTGSLALIQGTGGIVMGAGGTVTNSGGGTVAPGTSPGTLLISGNYVQTSTGMLNIELGGTIAGTGFDQLQVTGNVSLDGTVNVVFCCTFTGAPGNAYEIVTTTVPNSISGNFATINPPTGFTTTTGPFSSTLTQSGGPSFPVVPGPSPSPSSNSSSGSMQFINDVIVLNEVDTMPPMDQIVEDQRKGLSNLVCGPGSQ